MGTHNSVRFRTFDGRMFYQRTMDYSGALELGSMRVFHRRLFGIVVFPEIAYALRSVAYYGTRAKHGTDTSA